MVKINKLLSEWPRGAVYTSSYLKKQGFSKQLIHRYKKSGWLKSIGNGAYIPERWEVDWVGGIFPLQTQLHLPVHPGGKTALILKGMSHFVRRDLISVSLFTYPETRLPEWFVGYPWETKIQVVTKNLFSGELETSFTDYHHREFSIRISSAERAAIEMMYLIPVHESFKEAFLMLENLITLRPQVVQLLLENCNSIKAKRLFLYMAEKLGVPWFDKISLQNVDLGKGKRSVIKGGQLDKKYQITVPAEF